jgi:hypothetical protein
MNENASPNPFDDAPVVFQYTRAQAIEDGVLIDLTEWAKETGFRIPVACTDTVWNGYIVPTDILWMLFCAIRKHGDGDTLFFEVAFLQSPNRHDTVRLKSVCGPGDQGEPVLTIMLPHED